MIKAITTSVILFLGVNLFAQEGDKAIVRVQKVNGMEVYILNEPLRGYEVVSNEKSGLKAESLLTGGLINEGISGKINQFVRRVKKAAEKGNYEVEAMLYTSGKDAIGIRFTEEATVENKGLARATKSNGLFSFLMCEPLTDYNVEITKKGGMKLGSAITGGLVNKSIEGDFEQLAKKIRKQANKKNIQLDGIIYTSGKSASGIAFR